MVKMPPYYPTLTTRLTSQKKPVNNRHRFDAKWSRQVEITASTEDVESAILKYAGEQSLSKMKKLLERRDYQDGQPWGYGTPIAAVCFCLPVMTMRQAKSTQCRIHSSMGLLNGTSLKMQLPNLLLERLVLQPQNFKPRSQSGTPPLWLQLKQWGN